MEPNYLLDGTGRVSAGFDGFNDLAFSARIWYDSQQSLGIVGGISIFIGNVVGYNLLDNYPRTGVRVCSHRHPPNHRLLPDRFVSQCLGN